jgi:hypothetical protein
MSLKVLNFVPACSNDQGNCHATNALSRKNASGQLLLPSKTHCLQWHVVDFVACYFRAGGLHQSTPKRGSALSFSVSADKRTAGHRRYGLSVAAFELMNRIGRRTSSARW